MCCLALLAVFRRTGPGFWSWVECGHPCGDRGVGLRAQNCRATMYPGLLRTGSGNAGDRGPRFLSCTAFPNLATTGVRLLWRVKAMPRCRCKRNAPTGPTIPPPRPARGQEQNTEQVPVRMIECTGTDGNGAGKFSLITTILGPDQAPAGDLAESYAGRPGNRVLLRSIQDPPTRPVLGFEFQDPDEALQEIHGHPCVRYALRSLLGEVPRIWGRPPAHLLHASSRRPHRGGPRPSARIFP